MRWPYALFAVRGVLLVIITALLAAIAVLLAVVAVLIAIPLFQVMFAGGTGILLLIIAAIWVMGSSLIGRNDDEPEPAARAQTSPPASDDTTPFDTPGPQRHSGG